MRLKCGIEEHRCVSVSEIAIVDETSSVVKPRGESRKLFDFSYIECQHRGHRLETYYLLRFPLISPHLFVSSLDLN